MALATRPKPPAHSRKRYAGHHRHNKRYLSSYWPYLPMLVVVGLGLLVNSTWSKTAVLGSRSDISAVSLLSDTNAERLDHNEQALTLDSQLSAAAQAKAEDMVRSDYWAHESPSGRTPWSFITSSGYQYSSAGENLAYGFASAEDSVAGWMASPEHRANLLDPEYKDVGFGVATSPDYLGHGRQTVVVAEYARPAGAQAAPQVLAAESKAKPVSRIQIMAGDNAAWALIAVIILSGGAMALFLLRHGYRLQRLVSRGEAFVVHHPYFDIAVVCLITAGVVLTRSGGIIH